jgi:hypothetical protein
MASEQLLYWRRKLLRGSRGAVRYATLRILTVAILLAAGCAPAQNAPAEDRQEVISGIKDLEKVLGFPETHNFRTESLKLKAYYRCYYTGKFDLAASYDGLKLVQGNQTGCAVDEEKYDSFFYPIEAVANGKTPVTSSLAESPMERLLMVVPHEDFHEHKGVANRPPNLSEAAATLIGFLTAAEFARTKFGANAEVYQNLSREAKLFLRKAQLVNLYHAKLGSLYASLRSGAVNKEEALQRKHELFQEAQKQCEAILPEPRSFNRCLTANNNAGLSFEVTYTKYYPLFYEVFLAEGRDVKTTVDTINRILADKTSPEESVVASLRGLVETKKPPLSSESIE